MFKTTAFLYDCAYQENIDYSEFEPKVKAIAFYLPQFAGHYQPREPHDDIGYYDLTNIETLKKQAKLARQHGIYGFCFYLYWFSGKCLLEKPLDLFLEHPEVDINFCLCWANENWTRVWDGQDKEVLMSQNYSNEDPYRFIENMQKYINDKRYIKINGDPIILVYNSGHIPNVKETFKIWKNHALEIGIGKIRILTCRVFGSTAKNLYIEELVDGEVEFPPHGISTKDANDIYLKGKIANIYNYKELVSEIKEKITDEGCKDKINIIPLYRTCMMAWDNASRRASGWSTFAGYSLQAFYEWTSRIIKETEKKYSNSEPFVFINAWNEWGEGTYLEPDKKYGYANINTFSKAIFRIPFNMSLHLKNKVEMELIKRHPEIAVQIHLYYLDLIDEIISYVNIIPFPFDCYISTDSEEKVHIIKENFIKEGKR